jgi:hypothetical protein
MSWPFQFLGTPQSLPLNPGLYGSLHSHADVAGNILPDVANGNPFVTKLDLSRQPSEAKYQACISEFPPRAFGVQIIVPTSAYLKEGYFFAAKPHSIPRSRDSSPDPRCRREDDLTTV